MAQSKREIEALLAEAGSHPRHRFGQNFMIDQNLVRVVAEAGMVTPGDCVIEVGPGTGTLTEELLERAGNVIAVEIDRDLAAMLRNRFTNRANFRLIEGDALASKHAINAELLVAIQAAAGEAGLSDAAPNRAEDGPALLGKPAITPGSRGVLAPVSSRPLKLVANLPYNIASPLIIELLSAGVGLLAFTVQKEVGQRLCASAGSDDYGPLTVMAQTLASVEFLRTLPPQAFWPAPSIDSALVRITRRAMIPVNAAEFGGFVHSLFGFRRKMLRKALAQTGVDPEKLLQASGFDGTKRLEEFSPGQILNLFQTWQAQKIPA